jgi:hypothetical protein
VNVALRVVAVLALAVVAVLGGRRLLAMSNTQVHRINQEKSS